MDKKKISEIIDKSLKMKVGDVKDAWKAPAIVAGDNFILTRANTKDEAIELRDRVKAALKDKYIIGQGIIEFDPVNVRYYQRLTISDKQS